MKKILIFVLTLMMLISTAACAGGSASPSSASSTSPSATAEPDASSPSASAAVESDAASPSASAAAEPDTTPPSAAPALKACFITEYAKGNDYIDLIVAGFTQLQSEGWTVNTIEALDPVEYEEDIRDMATQGYDVIMMFGAELINVGVDLSDEFKDTYPSLRLVAIDTNTDFQKDNITSICVDPYEAAFVAGYVAAMTTKTGTVGCIMHSDSPLMRRFSDGYDAGIAYTNNNTQMVLSISGSPTDVTLANEAAKTMMANYPVDIIYQVCYTAGTGVITACADAGIKCIGVDGWQGYIDPCVFWSTLKPMDVAVSSIAKMYAGGGQLPGVFVYNIENGCAAYDDRDFEKLPADLQAKVTAVMDGIANGTIDVYAKYPQDAVGF